MPRGRAPTSRTGSPRASRREPRLAAHRQVVARHRAEPRLHARLRERVEQRLGGRACGRVERQLERLAPPGPNRGRPTRPRRDRQAGIGRARGDRGRDRRGATRPAPRAPDAARSPPRASAARAAAASRCRAGATRSAARRSATPRMPCGLPRATTRPCSRRHRCTSWTGSPPSAPRANGRSSGRWPRRAGGAPWRPPPRARAARCR